jgi:hypothetical protein
LPICLRASSVTYLFAIFLFTVPCVRFGLLEPCFTTGARDGYNAASFAIQKSGTRMEVETLANVGMRRILRWRN